MKKEFKSPSLRVLRFETAEEITSISVVYDEDDRIDGSDVYGKEHVGVWPPQ